MRLGLRDPRPQAVDLRAWRVFQAIPRKAWATARQIVEELGNPDITSLDLASAIRAKLASVYVKRREDPRTRSLRWQYQRAPQ